MIKQHICDPKNALLDRADGLPAHVTVLDLINALCNITDGECDLPDDIAFIRSQVMGHWTYEDGVTKVIR